MSYSGSLGIGLHLTRHAKISYRVFFFHMGYNHMWRISKRVSVARVGDAPPASSSAMSLASTEGRQWSITKSQMVDPLHYFLFAFRRFKPA